MIYFLVRGRMGKVSYRRMSTATGPQNCQTAWPKDALRISFGVIWAIDAALKWLPSFRSMFMGTIMGEADGQPRWLHPWFTFWIHIQHPRVNFFVDLVAVVETLIAIALILGFARKITYISAALFSLVVWATAEGFGGPYTVGASDIGTAIIYAVVFLNLLAISYYAGPARYSVDFILERRISWWWKVAELRRPETPQLVDDRVSEKQVPQPA